MNDTQVQEKVGQAENDTMPESAFTFTNRYGKKVVMDRIEVPYSLLTSLHRLQENFEARGEYMSMRGVIEHVIDKGIMYTENVWKSVDTGREKRSIDKLYNGRLDEILASPEKADPSDVIAILAERKAKLDGLKKRK